MLLNMSVMMNLYYHLTLTFKEQQKNFPTYQLLSLFLQIYSPREMLI